MNFLNLDILGVQIAISASPEKNRHMDCLDIWSHLFYKNFLVLKLEKKGKLSFSELL